MSLAAVIPLVANVLRQSADVLLRRSGDVALRQSGDAGLLPPAPVLNVSAELRVINIEIDQNDGLGDLFPVDAVETTDAQTADPSAEAATEVEWDATPLVGAIRRGDLESVKNLSAEIPNMTNLQVDGMSLLYIAVFKQRHSVIEYLLSRGCNINARNEEDYDSPLILARRRGDTELIRLLLTPIHRLGGLAAADQDANGQQFWQMIESPSVTSTDATVVPNAPSTSLQECSICFCDLNDENDASTSMAALEKCGHACCSGCLSAFLSARIADTTSMSLVPVIRCFARDCNAPVSFRDFETFAPREAVQLYQLRLTTAACRLMPEFSWCTKCESGGFISCAVNSAGNEKPSSSNSNCRDVHCDSCQHAYCSDCREDAHTGFTCAQKYEQVMSGDHFITERMSTRALQKLTKPCPQCAAPTIRDGGCSHMTCRACSFAWCWLCGNAYTGRYTFGNKCPCGS